MRAKRLQPDDFPGLEFYKTDAKWEHQGKKAFDIGERVVGALDHRIKAGYVGRWKEDVAHREKSGINKQRPQQGQRGDLWGVAEWESRMGQRKCWRTENLKIRFRLDGSGPWAGQDMWRLKQKEGQLYWRWECQVEGPVCWRGFPRKTLKSPRVMVENRREENHEPKAKVFTDEGHSQESVHGSDSLESDGLSSRRCRHVPPTL